MERPGWEIGRPEGRLNGRRKLNSFNPLNQHHCRHHEQDDGFALAEGEDDGEEHEEAARNAS